MSIATTALTILSILSEVEKDAPLVISFIENTVTAVENTKLSGTDKLTAVLNASEAFLGSLLPNLALNIQAFMAAVEAFVNDLVALYNTAGVFIHAIKSV